MNQAEVHRLVKALKFKVQPKPFVIGKEFGGAYRAGPRYQLEIYRQAVTALVVNERIEMTRHKGMMVREYSERLLQEAITHGETHLPTMELADFWLVDKPAIHKLFKVLVPRLKDEPHAYTRYFNAPMQASAATIHGAPAGPGSTAVAAARYKDKCVLEIVGHPFPPLAYSNSQANKKMIHNVLLSEARREHRLAQAAAKNQHMSNDGEEID